MKKSQKQSWIKDNRNNLLGVIGTLIIIGIGLIFYFDSTSYICSKNPEKCVCEEDCLTTWENCLKNKKSDTDNCSDLMPKKCYYNDGYFHVVTHENAKCNKFRLKTQKELDVSNCTGNPRDDKDCKLIQNLIPHYYDHCDFDYINELPNFVSAGERNKDGNCSVLIYTLEKISRPKTECEKGNPDWVEETKIKKVDTSIVPHPECKLQTGWFCPAIGIVNLPCDNSTNTCRLESGLRYVGCGYEEDICIANQTICREETLCDKSNADFCVEMNDSRPNTPISEAQTFTIGEIQ